MVIFIDILDAYKNVSQVVCFYSINCIDFPKSLL